ncbi:MAG: hypothetical protein JF593_08575 [Novosphingobium sp.]|nr:hypothetical protein [Novosphingobium sp.]
MDSIKPERQDASRTGELIWLLGQPHLTDYVEFVRRKAVDGADIAPAALVNEWRAANDYYYELSEREAGIAETIGCRPLPRQLRSLETAVRAHPWFQRSFGELPTTIAMVELDKLIASQIHVERGHHFAAAGALGRELEARFHFCIPLERELPPVRIQRLGENRWMFSSQSTDLRSRAVELVGADKLAALGIDGPVAAMIGVPVGFGSNFMSAVRSGKRIALQNGYHRAYALRSAGITHAPCIIEDVTRKDELRLGGDAELNADPEFYFAAPRPPLLKDFFDPRIAKTLQVRPIDTVVEVEITVRSTMSTDWS